MKSEYMTPRLVREELVEELDRCGMMTDLVQAAIQQTETSHEHQKRDNGMPYLEEHIYPMTASILRRHTDPMVLEKLVVTALLHDVVEDDAKLDMEKFRTMFGEEITGYVVQLSKNKKDPSRVYTQCEKMGRNREMLESLSDACEIVKIVKMEDRLNNLASIVMVGDSPKYARYLEETEKYYVPFAQKAGGNYPELLREQLDRLKSTAG